MIYELDIKLAIELLAGAVFGFLMWMGSRRTHKDGQNPRTLRLGFFTSAVNNVILIIAVAVPVLVGLLSYLSTKAPLVNYSSMYAAITFLFLALVVAVWLTFAILKKATDEEKITLSFPKDRRFITAMGLLYAFIVTGLVYFAHFFLFDLPAPSRANAGMILLARPKAQVGQTREEIERMWGRPNSTGTMVEYKTLNSSIRLVFDASGRLEKTDEIKEFR